MLNSNYKPPSIRLRAGLSQWVSEEPLSLTILQEDLRATNVHRVPLHATLRSQRVARPNRGAFTNGADGHLLRWKVASVLAVAYPKATTGKTRIMRPL
jgi:hypothetical protein